MAKLGRAYLAEAVRNHAQHYADAGWDVVEETLSDGDIAQWLGRTRTVTGAVTTIAENVVRPWVSQLVETRPGSDDDEQLQVLARFNEERRTNVQDATLWWPEDKREELLRRMTEPEGAIISVPVPAQAENVDSGPISGPDDPAATPESGRNPVAAQTPKPRATGQVRKSSGKRATGEQPVLDEEKIPVAAAAE